ncbi:MAG: carboxypeptidase M32 [Bdellovibrionales bacterium]|nr:carboxypeptidase M32 [Bdellovibrionales bacterium]
MSNSTLLTTIYKKLEEIDHLQGVMTLLGWDQSTMMPAAAAAGRAQQRALMASLLHTRRSDPALLDAVDTLAARSSELDLDDRIVVRELKRDCDRARKLPSEHVAERARTAAESYTAWKSARPRDDFASVQPFLESLLALNRREAELIGYQTEPYDALLDAFEPEAKIAEVGPLLLRLGEKLSKLIPQIQQRQADFRPLSPFELTIDTQMELCRLVCERIGFSFDSGRLDATTHPFAASPGPGDFRITTRFRPADPLSSLYSTLHEAGHAFYERGLPASHRSSPLGQSVSLGIHESQSLLWEDVIGRSEAFLEFLQPLLAAVSAGSFSPDPRALWERVNVVQPSLIRVDADEVTYSLHIVIRMELELALLNDELSVKELPSAWDDRYRHYLGVTAPSVKDGVLQDVHWFSGAVGYFPTYSLGKLHAAMFYEQMQQELPTLDDCIRSGNFTPLHQWLTDNVHQHGRRYSSTELVRRCCNSEPNEDALIRYVQQKFGLD